MADMELSLDDIIKKRNIKTNQNSQKFGERKQQQPIKRLSDGKKPSFPVLDVPDARFKLMKRRSDPGPVVDARQRLQAIRSRMRPVRRPPGVAVPLRRSIHGRLGGGIHPRDIALPEPLMHAMDVDMYDYAAPAIGGPLMRTIENEMMAPPARRRPFDWDRPTDDEESMEMILDRADRMNVSRTLPVRQGQAFRPGAPDWDDITITVHAPPSHGPPQPQQSILKRPTLQSIAPAVAANLVLPRPVGSGLTLSQRFNRDRNAEASVKVEQLKAQLKAAKGESPVPAKLEEGYRIVVSNLKPSVSEEDVQELFSDVGDLITAKLVRPGVAEVVYVTMKDALAAVETYHNRQLDKQPMKCLLVKNQSRKNVRPPVELDMTTLKNALHKKAAS